MSRKTVFFPLSATIAVAAIFSISAVNLALAQNAAQPTTDRFGQQTKASDAKASLPNGATSINETFGDWAVSCAIADNRKTCALSQQQGNSQT